MAHFLPARDSAPPVGFEAFEGELSGLMRQLQADLTGAELARYNVEAERIVVEGHELRRVPGGIAERNVNSYLGFLRLGRA